MGYARTSLKGVMLYDSAKAFRGFTLFTPAEGKGALLIDMLGRQVNQWQIPFQPGYDAQLLPNGNLLYSGKIPDSPLTDVDDAGGGILLEVDWDSKVVWEHKELYSHHAFYRTKSGTTLMLKWVEVPREIATKVKGGDPGTEREGVMWGDAIQEINPKGEVVWQWLAHEHFDPETTVRCPLCPRSVWTHANAVSELPDGNILASFMKINTIAIIDKKTGDIKWQWGSGEIAHQHSPVVLDNGHVLVLDNGMHPNNFAFSSSRVIEINPKDNKIVWEYGGMDHDKWGDWAGRKKPNTFYTSTMGNCQRLPNGNTLICEGTTGRICEVNSFYEIVWEFAYDLPSGNPPNAPTRSHMVCTAYRYGMDYSGLKDPMPLSIEKQLAPGFSAPEGATVSKGEDALKARLAHLGY